MNKEQLLEALKRNKGLLIRLTEQYNAKAEFGRVEGISVDHELQSIGNLRMSVKNTIAKLQEELNNANSWQ